MVEPVQSTNITQLHLDFGERFLQVAWKETDRAVVAILKGLATLGLNGSEVDAVMSTIARYAPGVADHAEVD